MFWVKEKAHRKGSSERGFIELSMYDANISHKIE